MSLSIRQRLTLWYSLAIATLLGVTSFSLIVVYDRVSLARLDTLTVNPLFISPLRRLKT